MSHGERVIFVLWRLVLILSIAWLSARPDNSVHLLLNESPLDIAISQLLLQVIHSIELRIIVVFPLLKNLCKLVSPLVKHVLLLLGLVRLIFQIFKLTLQLVDNLLELLALCLHSVRVVLLGKCLAILLLLNQVYLFLQIALLLQMRCQRHVLSLDLRGRNLNHVLNEELAVAQFAYLANRRLVLPTLAQTCQGVRLERSVLLDAVLAGGLPTEVTVRVLELLLVFPGRTTHVTLAGALIELLEMGLGHEEDSIILIKNVRPLTNGECLTSLQQDIDLISRAIVHELTADATPSRLVVLLLYLFEVFDC